MESAELTYGSDRDGLVWGYLLRPGQPATPVDSATAAGWLAETVPAPASAFLWLYFSLSNAAAERWLGTHLALPDAFLQSLHGSARSTRLEQDDDALVAVLHDVTFDFSFDPAAVSSVSLCIQPRLFVSARVRPLRSVDRLRASVRAGQTFRSSSELLAHLLHEQAEVVADVLRVANTRVDEVEDQLLAQRIPMSRRELSALRRTLVRLQRLLAPEPAALFRLLSRPPGWITAEDLQDLRQAAEEFSTTISDSAALVERIKILQEELAAIINEQTSRTLFVLTVVTVLALPINLTAGVFGMNVGGVPFSRHPHGFLLVAATLAGFTLLLGYLALGRGKR